jgi:hypothetical protein
MIIGISSFSNVHEQQWQHVYGMIACTNRNGMSKISYDNLVTILKAGLLYLGRVNLKKPLHFFDKAPHPKC